MWVLDRCCAHTRRNLLRQLPKQCFKTAVAVADEGVVQNELPCQCDQIPALNVRAFLLYEFRYKAWNQQRPEVQHEHTCTRPPQEQQHRIPFTMAAFACRQQQNQRTRNGSQPTRAAL
ncbi:hypothetical protein D3C78_1170050 [compost metagenome]